MSFTKITSRVIEDGAVTPDALAPQQVYIYDTNVSSNIVLTSGKNGLSVGPITIANNVSINIASNSRWVVI
jgi:hypothetical protein